MFVKMTITDIKLMYRELKLYFIIISNTNINHMCNKNKYAVNTVTLVHVNVLFVTYLMDC
jgi:hypothetical protein